MFDQPETLVSVGDSTLIDAITAGERAEAVAAYGRLAATGELVARRCAEQGAREWWACDGWDAVAAEIGAALNIGARGAKREMRIAMALRVRHRRIAALLAAGDIPLWLVEKICWHTAHVEDLDTIALIDTALAGTLGGFGRLTDAELVALIDGWVHKFDPTAVRRTREAARARDVQIAKPDDHSGAVALWGSLLATDGAVLDARLTMMAHQVCPDDPRTLGQRRSDALGTLGAGSLVLACLCGKTDCPAAALPDARAAAVVVHVLAETVPTPAKAEAKPQTGAEPQAGAAEPAPAPVPLAPAGPAQALGDPLLHGPIHQPWRSRDATARPAFTVDRRAIGYLLGGMVIPAILLADLIARGATVRTITSVENLTVHGAGQDSYRPSVALDEFVRMRAMTCTFPGCDRPATNCDLDHTLPWPAGPTHPGNLSPKCRKHHLLKTFWTGPGGWRDRQLPDGTVVWTAPTGHTYLSVPGSRILFPGNTINTPLPPPAPPDVQLDTAPGRGLMMPTRRRTRTQDTARRIAYERKLNQQELTKSDHEKIATPRQLNPKGTWDDILTSHHPPDPNDAPPF